MARQLILLACLAAVAFSSWNCYYAGPPVGTRCSTNTAIGDSCYQCSEGTLPSTCVEVGPAIQFKCPNKDNVVKDPFGYGVCMKCPSTGR